MSRFLSWNFWLALVLIAPALSAQESISWETDLPTSLKRSQAERKLVLLHFYFDACAPCRAVEQNVFSRPEVAASMHKNFIPVKVNRDKQPDVVKRYQVKSYPTDVLVTSVGLEIGRMTTPAAPAAYVDLLDKIAVQAGVGAARLNDQVHSAADRVGATAESWRNMVNQNAQAARDSAEKAANQIAGEASASLPGETSQDAATAPPAGAMVQNQFVNRGAAPAAAVPRGPYSQSPPPAAGQAANVANAGGAQGPTTEAPAGESSVYGEAPGQVANSGPPRDKLWQPNSSPDNRAQLANKEAVNKEAPPAAKTVWQGLQNQTAPDITAKPQVVASQFVPADKAPPVALEGYCPVAILDFANGASGKKTPWVKGSKRWGAIHYGRTYLFSSEEAQKRFLASPDQFAPVLSGYDPVRFAKTGQLVDGKVGLSVKHPTGNGTFQCLFFADEAAIEEFKKNPKVYLGAVYQAMQRGETKLR